MDAFCSLFSWGRRPAPRRQAGIHRQGVTKRRPPNRSITPQDGFNNDLPANQDGDEPIHQATRAKATSFTPLQRPQYIVDQLEALAEAIENNTRVTLMRHNHLLRLVERLRAEVELGRMPIAPSQLPANDAESPDDQLQQHAQPDPTTFPPADASSQSPLSQPIDHLPRSASGFPQTERHTPHNAAAPFIPRDNRLRPIDRREPHDLPVPDEL